MKRLVIIRNGVVRFNNVVYFEKLEQCDNYIEAMGLSNEYEEHEQDVDCQDIELLMNHETNDYLLFGDNTDVCIFHDRNFRTIKVYDPVC